MKTPILFLPGMMCDQRVFSPQCEFLKRISWPHAVADLSQERSINEMAEDSFNLAYDRGWKEIIVCGLSMGGIVAMEMMKIVDTLDVVGAILIDTNHLADAPEKKKKRNRQNQEVIDDPDRFTTIIKEEMKPFYLEENQSRKAKKLWDLFYDMAVTLGKKVFIKQNLALRDRDSSEEVLRNFGKDCLILCGKGDPLCPPERHRAMTELLERGELHIIPRAGHIANLERPKEVNAIVGGLKKNGTNLSSRKFLLIPRFIFCFPIKTFFFYKFIPSFPILSPNNFCFMIKFFDSLNYL